MDFLEILDHVVDLLRQRGRLTYHTLKRQLNLDAKALEDLKIELIEGQRLAIDEQRTVLMFQLDQRFPLQVMGFIDEKEQVFLHLPGNSFFATPYQISLSEVRDAALRVRDHVRVGLHRRAKATEIFQNRVLLGLRQVSEVVPCIRCFASV
jgi:hypothetical protein